LIGLIDIVLTEQVKGNNTVTIKKECPSCRAEMFFGVKDGKVVLMDGVCYWESYKNQIVKCTNCDAKYRFDVTSI
jgi:hypothetical protein